MGKRYGRTQKRKHRERIDVLEMANDHSTELIGHLDKILALSNSKYKELVQEIRRWWDHSVLLDPSVEQHHGEIPPSWRVAKSDRPHRFDLEESMNPSASMNYHYEILEALRVSGFNDIGTMQMHFRLEFSGLRAGYFLDRRALDHFGGFPREAVRYIQEALIHQFTEAWKEGR